MAFNSLQGVIGNKGKNLVADWKKKNLWLKTRSEGKTLIPKKTDSGNTYALNAPPPFAWPSNLVTITEATSTFSLNAFA